MQLVKKRGNAFPKEFKNREDRVTLKTGARVKIDIFLISRRTKGRLQKKNCKISDIVQKGGEGSGKW